MVALLARNADEPGARQLFADRLVVFDHLREILGGPIVWTPGIDGAVAVSLRGGDFLFESGEDLSIGYERADEESVHLYAEESFSFRVATPEAAVALP